MENTLRGKKTFFKGNLSPSDFGCIPYGERPTEKTPLTIGDKYSADNPLPEEVPEIKDTWFERFLDATIRRWFFV